MKWITREQIRIDRVSSAWLIKKFVDPSAEFLFVPRTEVMPRAQAEEAIPFHVPDAELGQRDGKTAFDAIIAKYNLTDPALLLLADMVRAADRRLPDPPEGAGVAAMSHGFAAMGLPDEEVLALQSPMWEALYHFCRTKVKG
ncbi:MAG: chromate resistance protein [Caldilinea sp. CFX5]|nr:chromate resistance protein [Caldilinea sp. CFX5]